MTSESQTTGDAAHGFILQAIVRLEEQSELAEELTALARGQASLITEGQADELLVVLERRQALIDRLLRVVDEITPLAEVIQHAPEAATTSQRERVRSLVDSIGARLAEVIEIDSTDRARLHERLNDIQRDMNVNGTARTANRAYGRVHAESTSTGPLAGATTRFTDRKG